MSIDHINLTDDTFEYSKGKWLHHYTYIIAELDWLTSSNEIIDMLKASNLNEVIGVDVSKIIISRNENIGEVTIAFTTEYVLDNVIYFGLHKRNNEAISRLIGMKKSGQYTEEELIKYMKDYDLTEDERQEILNSSYNLIY